ncbi:MAG: EAL domain-containing protein [Lachnospiraceae bacterium]|nr:EAL domain-containing protein [Lachnospiraceae bacterium]
MFTWNLQYVSKIRLSETIKQLMPDPGKGDILVRIHTAIHTPDDAVELAAFVKNALPTAHILGTSTSAVLFGGRMLPDQCIISITQMSEGSIKTLMRPLKDDGDDMIPAEEMCLRLKSDLVCGDDGMMLTFFTEQYREVKHFVEQCNAKMPSVRLIGGIVNKNNMGAGDRKGICFVFDETGWYDEGMIAAAITGKTLESTGAFASGTQVVGKELPVTESEGNRIIKIADEDAAVVYREGVGDGIRNDPDIGFLFPLVYCEEGNVPFMIGYYEDGLRANHNIEVGKKLKRGFIYDGRCVEDNRRMFSRIENFQKAETIFGYTCRDRVRIYPSSVKWELSVYENSNLSGCLTEGEIAFDGEKNVFVNCAFVVMAVGEHESVQQYNPYVFSNVDMIGEDNRRLISYLMDIESRYERGGDEYMASSLREFVKDCELRVLYSEKESLLNEAALSMDIDINGYDRVCLIDVLDTAGMRMVFSEQMIEMTCKGYISRCAAFVSGKDYRLYKLDKWQLAIAAPSYMVSFSTFVKDMRQLQSELFKTGEDYIAIVPVFCIINDAQTERIRSVYSSARMEMVYKNIQFYICDEEADRIDEETIREKYHMVNVINYALSNDKVIPYFQGIYDNKTGTMHHYESLMRLEDENGKVYYPGSFLDVARKFGLLYDSLSMIMIRKVFEIFRDFEDKSVSINLGIRDIKNTEMKEYIYSFLATVRHPGNFIFEILENEDVDDYEELVTFVDKVHALGARISIDDFGSGYSNLQHIASIHSDYIKIDGSIVKNCCEDQESENLVALISGWKNLSIRDVKLVAEYVENEAIQKKLKQYDIDFSQGYLFSRPSPKIRDPRMDPDTKEPEKADKA